MGYKHDIDEIIGIGSELFRKRGYHNVGINEILKAGGIPKGSFYNFFESKEDFARQVLDFYGNYSLNRIQEYLRNTELSPLERLKAFYRWTVEANEEDGLDAGCLVNVLSMEMGGLNRDLGSKADEQFRMWVDEIARCVQEGQEAGEITTKYSAQEIAEYLHAGTYGGFSRMKASKSLDYLEKWYEMTFEFLKA